MHDPTFKSNIFKTWLVRGLLIMEQMRRNNVCGDAMNEYRVSFGCERQALGFGNATEEDILEFADDILAQLEVLACCTDMLKERQQRLRASIAFCRGYLNWQYPSMTPAVAARVRTGDICQASVANQ